MFRVISLGVRCLTTTCRHDFAAVKKRGKSDIGAKTMLDVLVPVQATLLDHRTLSPAELIVAVRQTATEALESTRQMKAIRGRASFLGDRSIGHLDPGAASSNLLIQTICDMLEKGK